MANQTRVLVALAAVVVLAAGFWWLDFRAARGEFRAEYQVAAFGFRNEPVEGVWPKRDLVLYVDGDGGLEAAVAGSLKKSLERSPSFARVEELSAPPDQAQGAALLVEVGERDGLWTPVYSRSGLSVNMAYASDGDLSWRDDKTVVMSGEGERVVRVRGEFQVRDTTAGVTSHAGYERELGRQIAAEVSKALERAVSPPGTV